MLLYVNNNVTNSSKKIGDLKKEEKHMQSLICCLQLKHCVFLSLFYFYFLFFVENISIYESFLFYGAWKANVSLLWFWGAAENEHGVKNQRLRWRQVFCRSHYVKNSNLKQMSAEKYYHVCSIVNSSTNYFWSGNQGIWVLCCHHVAIMLNASVKNSQTVKQSLTLRKPIWSVSFWPKPSKSRKTQLHV